MKSLSLLRFLGLTVMTLVSLSMSAHFNYEAIWKDAFSKSEKEKLIQWIDEVGDAVEQTIGVYPFQVQIYFHRANKSSEPVPWAHTDRNEEQAVHFHVDPSYNLQSFLNDWTAAHEISHLSIPYVGKEYSWFSEGYASFMQWQIMQVQGVITKSELKEKYVQRISRAKLKYASKQSFLSVFRFLRNRHDYPSVYYGGACYFLKVNQILIKDCGTTLMDAITKYQSYARLKDDNVSEVVQSLDEIVGCKAFSKVFEVFIKGTAHDAVFSTKIAL